MHKLQTSNGAKRVNVTDQEKLEVKVENLGTELDSRTSNGRGLA